MRAGLFALVALLALSALGACSPLESWNQFDQGSSIKQGDSGATGPDAFPPNDTSPSSDAGPPGDAGIDTGMTAGQPTFVQSFSTNSDNADAGVMSVTLSFLAPQVEGDTNVVVVGWYDKHALQGPPTDTSGNTYQKAVGPLTSPDAPQGIATQVVYYAPGIKAAGANANTVTVSWSTTTDYYPDVTILEFAGLDRTAPLDVTSQGSGASGDQGGATTSSGSATTTFATDLVLGAGTAVAGYMTAGAGFTEIVLTSDDDVVEQEVVTSAGPYAATAPLMQGGGGWVMQLVAFH